MPHVRLTSSRSPSALLRMTRPACPERPRWSGWHGSSCRCAASQHATARQIPPRCDIGRTSTHSEFRLIRPIRQPLLPLFPQRAQRSIARSSSSVASLPNWRAISQRLTQLLYWHAAQRAPRIWSSPKSARRRWPIPCSGSIAPLSGKRSMLRACLIA